MGFAYEAANISGGRPMDIRVVSSLSPEDEDTIAPSILAMVRRLLDRLPIAYAIRVETTNKRVLHHSAAADFLFPGPGRGAPPAC
jgi:hypothetical protein